MDNLSIYNRVRTVPDSAKKKIQGGRMSGKTDINPMWRIKVLTETFGPCGIGWYYKTTKQWTEIYGDEIAAFVNIELFIKVDGEWSQPIFGVGGSMFVAKEKTGPYVSDECFKMATTDAISVACKQLGIAADVYWDKDPTKYNQNNDNPQHESDTTAEDPRLQHVYDELRRTGYSVLSLCKTYKLNDISQISDLQIKDFLKRVKNLPDKDSLDRSTEGTG